jgi:hypothetical protein
MLIDRHVVDRVQQLVNVIEDGNVSIEPEM